MTANVQINPGLTSNAAGTFGISWNGGMQGTAVADPSARNWLAGGFLNPATETLPMWGGVGIYEDIPTPGYNPAAPAPNAALGPPVGRATQIAQGAGQLTGFSVFDQNYSMINSPQSTVPLTPVGMTVHFYRFGSNQRVWLAMSPLLVDLYGDIITTPLSWDFTNQVLIPYVAAYAGASVQSATYTSSTGILAMTFATAPFGASVGSTLDGVPITLSGWNTAALNGDFPITSTATSGTVINVQVAAGLGALSPSGGSLVSGGGAVQIRGVMRVEPSSSMVVSYDPTTGFANWNRQGAALLALL